MGEAAGQRSRTRERNGGPALLRAPVRASLRSPGRLRRAATVLAAAGLTLLSGSALAPAAQASEFRIGPATASASPARTAVTTASDVSAVGTTYPAVVSLVKIDPPVPVAGQKITITGTVKNGGSSTIQSLQVGLAVGTTKIANRYTISTIAGDTTPQPSDAQELANVPTQQLGPLVAGATSPQFTITVNVNDLGLTAGGVYELDVDATSGGPGSQSLGVARTFLPYDPSPGTAQATQVATLWPLVDQPRVQAQVYHAGTTQSAGQAVLTEDDSLIQELGYGGRLNQLVTNGSSVTASPLKLTWVIDPDLIDTVNSMRNGYQVVSDAQGSVAAATPECNCTRKGSQAGVTAARQWLLQLQSALVGLNSSQVISLAYADPDLAALAHHPSESAALVSELAAVGSASVPDLLQVDANDSVAWPYRGYVDPQVVSLAQNLHDTQIVTNSDSLPYGVSFTPNAARSLGNGTTAVVADSTISDIFSGDLTTESEQTMAEQRFLAETLETTQEQPGVQRSILIQPPRDMSTSTADTLLASLQAAYAGKWIQPVSYGTVAAAKPTPDTNTTLAPYPASVRGNELPSLPDVSSIEADLNELQKIITPPDPYRAQFDAAILRSVSTQWRDQPQAGLDYQTNTQDYLTSLLNSVSILAKPTGVTLPGSNSATIPITVENNLPQTLTNLVVRLTSMMPNRLAVEGTGIQKVTNAGNTKPSYKFQVKAAANGKVKLVAKLFINVDGQLVPYNDLPTTLASIDFEVNVTQVSDGVIAVIAGGVLLVLLAGFRLYWKRRKDASLASGDSPDGPDGPNGPNDAPSGSDDAPDGTTGGPPGTDDADEAPEPGADTDEEAESGQPGGHDPENGVQSPV
ncbi:DUF6049 family protein [Streptacidiphilus sp. P02-A3a]|uniref:DUF6049 family protein n=1 Tax=Streptacidiphilus sp. P02-A3a TaxID=2704468 RepID=UPI0015FBF894|nr:DUF6049 family protein [Streptacidiphilus sp. P02-A3a]QMU73479.1 hypothetical protein GXP74_39940 [Streptacidiphilus sp. P02-A3a]